MNPLEKICDLVERKQKVVFFILPPLFAFINLASALFILWAILSKE